MIKRNKIYAGVLALSTIIGASSSLVIAQAHAEPNVENEVENIPQPKLKAPDLIKKITPVTAQTVGEEVLEEPVQEDYVPITDFYSSLEEVAVNTITTVTMQNQGYIPTSNVVTSSVQFIEQSEEAGELAVGIVNEALKYVGVPYVWGGTTPSGFDCSGLIQYAYNKHGISIPRTTWDQINAGTRVSISNVKPGDLVFYSNTGHVALYIGNNQVVHAPQPGENVKIASINMMPIEAITRIL